MSGFTAVDGGLRGCGCAVFRDGTLQSAWYKPNPARTGRGPKAWNAMAKAFLGATDHVVVVEYMQIYRGAKQKGDPNDVAEVNGVVGAICGAHESATGYLPRQWKGQVPKKIMGKRILSKLSAAEKKCIQKCPASLKHNVVDAIGIGLFHLGRL